MTNTWTVADGNADNSRVARTRQHARSSTVMKKKKKKTTMTTSGRCAQQWASSRVHIARLISLANTRSPEAPTAADIHLHVSPRPACDSACVRSRHMGQPAYTVSAVAQRWMPAHLQDRQPGRLCAGYGNDTRHKRAWPDAVYSSDWFTIRGPVEGTHVVGTVISVQPSHFLAVPTVILYMDTCVVCSPCAWIFLKFLIG